MNKNELEAFSREAEKSIKTEKDLNNFSQMLTGITVEAALNAELDNHLGYPKHESSGNENSRNRFSSKTLKTEDGQFDIETPRDRHGSFEPQLVKKQQTRFTSMDDKYPQINRSWRVHWDNLHTLFIYPQEIRKAIYTTNAIESLNSVIRKAIKKRKLFPTDDSAKKVVYLAIENATKKWTMPIRN